MEKKINTIKTYGKRNVLEFIKKNINSNISPKEWGVKEVLVKKKSI